MKIHKIILLMILVAIEPTHAQISALEFEYVNTNHTNSYYLGIDLFDYDWDYDDSTEMRTITPEHFKLKVNVLGVDYLRKDNYNKGLDNYSYAPTLLSELWLFSLTGFFRDLKNDHSFISNITTAIMFLPIAVSNTEGGYRLNPIIDDTENYLAPSLYLRSKLDWYTERKVDFWRYRPEIGISFDYAHKVNSEAMIGTTFSIGASYPMDYLYKSFRTPGWQISISAKLMFGKYIGTHSYYEERLNWVMK